MTWVRLDDKFHRNPKALKMSDSAHRIYVDALSYCADSKDLHGYLSFGEAEAFVRSRNKALKVLDELVDLGAWERLYDGYLIHDWTEYLPPRAKQRVIDWQSEKKAESIAFQSSIKGRLNADSPRVYPVPVPDPVPVGSKEPLSVGSPPHGLRLHVESKGHGLTDMESIGGILRRGHIAELGGES